MPLKESKKRFGSRNTNNYLPLCEKIVKIGPVYPEIICFNGSKKKEINTSKIYSLFGRHAKRAK